MFNTMYNKIIQASRRAVIPASRIALFTIFFWFGLLKVLGLSPASGMVQRLFEGTVPYMQFHTFLVGFGLFECLIGILFLIRGFERIALPLLAIHMFTTFGPLVLLPKETWQSFPVPTLEGQYIIKNLALIACGLMIAAQLEPQKN